MTTSLTVLYDSDCGICTHTARVLARVDSRRQLRLVAAQQADLPGAPPIDELLRSLHAVDGAGQWFVGGRASVEIARRVPILWPITLFARLPFALRVLDLGYRAVADHRQTLSRLLGLNACKVPTRNAEAVSDRLNGL
jgi:predicted DCC family thiol-disulfide oxidoreductase YuxK